MQITAHATQVIVFQVVDRQAVRVNVEKSNAVAASGIEGDGQVNSGSGV